MNHYDAIIIGAGFSGLYQLHFLRENLGIELSAWRLGIRVSIVSSLGFVEGHRVSRRHVDFLL